MSNKLNINKINLNDPQQLESVADYIVKNLKEGMTLQQATGIPNETLEEIYTLAYGYYNQGKYKESTALFQLLASISPKTYKYIFGLASSFHQLGLYQDSAAGFFIALEIEQENPIPAYYLLDSLNRLNLKEEALEVADFALDLCDNKPHFKELYNRISLLKTALLNK